MIDLTVLENLEVGAYNRNARKKKQETLDWVYELFPILKERRKQIAGTLSGGERQMLAVARGLMSAPKLLMLDEPSLGLAPKAIQSVFDVTKAINEDGVTVLLVEQNTRMSLKVANRAYVLENGRTTMEGKGTDLLENDYIKKTYLGL